MGTCKKSKIGRKNIRRGKVARKSKPPSPLPRTILRRFFPPVSTFSSSPLYAPGYWVSNDGMPGCWAFSLSVTNVQIFKISRERVINKIVCRQIHTIIVRQSLDISTDSFLSYELKNTNDCEHWPILSDQLIPCRPCKNVDRPHPDPHSRKISFLKNSGNNITLLTIFLNCPMGARPDYHLEHIGFPSSLANRAYMAR